MFHRRLHFGLPEQKHVICYLYLYLSLGFVFKTVEFKGLQ